MDKIVAACEGCAGAYSCQRRYDCKRYAKHCMLQKDFATRARYYIMPEACISGKYFIKMSHDSHHYDLLSGEAM